MKKQSHTLKQLALILPIFMLGLSFSFAQNTEPKEPKEETQIKIIRIEDGKTTVKEGEEAELDAEVKVLIEKLKEGKPEGFGDGEDGVLEFVQDIEDDNGQVIKKEVKMEQNEDGQWVKTEKTYTNGELTDEKVSIEDQPSFMWNGTTTLPDGLEEETLEKIQDILGNIQINATEGEEGKAMKLEVIIDDEMLEEFEGHTAAEGGKVMHKMVIIEMVELSDDEIETLKKSTGMDIDREKLNSLEINDLKYFPNPTPGPMNISFTTQDKDMPVLLQIMDLSGREVYREEIGTSEQRVERSLDLQNETSGTYVILISQGLQQIAKKFVIFSE